jgi:hydroxycarboxylate dehydrogenase B
VVTIDKQHPAAARTPAPSSIRTLKPQALHALISLFVRRMGSDEIETKEVADNLLRANLTGHDSHGVGMLPSYVRFLQNGLLVLNQRPQTVLDAGALLVIDARRGFGQRMAAEAVRRAIGRAKELGACVLALRNSEHIGRIGTYAEQAARQGMAFIAFVNVSDVADMQALYACAEPRLGTNPFCAAVPGADGTPAVLLDMATSTIAFGKARVAYNKGVDVPEGSLIDAEGRPTNDPTGLICDNKGALLAFGKHKGSGLAVMVEMMAGAMAGGKRAEQDRKGSFMNSMLAIVIDPAKFNDLASVAAGAASTAAHIRSSRVAPGFNEIQLPGEPERRSGERRGREGIPVDDGTWRDLLAAAAKLGITQDEIDQAVASNASTESLR